MFRWTFISILATREECAAGSAKTILVEVMAETGETKAVRFIWSTVVEMRLQIYLVESCTHLLMSVSVMHSVHILIVRYVFVCCLSLIRRHLACWTETMRYIFVTGTFQPFYVRYMYVRRFGFSTGLTFLPRDNKNSYPFYVRRFNPVKCDRGLRVWNLNYEEGIQTFAN